MSVILLDQFTDTNGTSLPSHTISPTNTPSTAWTAVTGTWAINNGGSFSIAQCNSGSGTTNICVCDPGQADVTVTCLIQHSNSPIIRHPALVVNYQDTSNYWLLLPEWSGAQSGHGSGPDAWNLYEVVSGSATYRDGTNATFVSSETFTLKVVTSGDTITLSVDLGSGYTQVATYTGSPRALKTQTKVGLRMFNDDNSGRTNWDNFQVSVGIEFDAASNSGYQTAQSSYSWSHTCSGSNRFLAVDVSVLSVPGTTVSSVTYNSVNLSLIGAKSTVSGAGRVECWGLANPATGSNTIAVTLSASVASAGTAASYTGVHQTTPTEAFDSAQATNVGAADATVSVTTVADNDWVHGAVATDDGSVTANQTSRNNVSGAGGSGANEDTGPKTPAGSVTVSYTGVGALATWAIGGYAIRPTAASSGTTVDVVGLSAGLGLAPGVGGPLIGGVGVAAGLGIAPGVSSVLVSATALSSGLGIAAGILAPLADTNAFSGGLGLLSGIASTLASGVGNSVSLGSPLSTASILADGTGNATGVGLAISSASVLASATSFAAGIGVVASSISTLSDASAISTAYGIAASVVSTLSSATGTTASLGLAVSAPSTLSSIVGATVGLGTSPVAVSTLQDVPGVASGSGKAIVSPSTLTSLAGVSGGLGMAMGSFSSTVDANAIGFAGGYGTVSGIAAPFASGAGVIAGASTVTSVMSLLGSVSGTSQGVSGGYVHASVFSSVAGSASGYTTTIGSSTVSEVFSGSAAVILAETTISGSAVYALPDGIHLLPVAGSISTTLPVAGRIDITLAIVIGSLAVAAEVNLECFRGEAPVIPVTLTAGTITLNTEIVLEILDGYEGLRLVRQVGYWNSGVIFGLTRANTSQTAKVYQYTVSRPLPGQEGLIAYGKFTIKSPGVAVL